MHMLNDQHRGPSLELAITKILHSKHAPAIQIVGMSATMGGMHQPVQRAFHSAYFVHDLTNIVSHMINILCSISIETPLGKQPVP